MKGVTSLHPLAPHMLSEAEVGFWIQLTFLRVTEPVALASHTLWLLMYLLCT